MTDGASASPRIKCVVWDLDNTLWDGVLLEGDDVRIRDEAVRAIRTLDERGVLHSIASRSDPEPALARLRAAGIDELFLVPQISWGAKAEAIDLIARQLDVGVDAIAFVDDDPFERDAVQARHPGVLAIDAAEIGGLVDRPELSASVTTPDARQRRNMYRAELERREDEQRMSAADFLASLGMVLTISRATDADLDRLEELTVRTHQLNSTGYTYDREELGSLVRSPIHRVRVAELEDRYGSYGKIGVSVVELRAEGPLLRLLLMSCRVMSRGVGRILLSHLLLEARAEGVPMRAEFIRTDRNRPMYLTFRLAGFREIGRDDGVALLEHDLAVVDPYPPHVMVLVDDPE